MKKRPVYSQLRERPRIDLREAVPLPMPLSLYVDPSSLCNFRCVFCPQSGDNKDILSSTMSLDSFVKIVQGIKELGRLKTLNLFSYGEPLLNPLTPEFLRLAVQEGIAEKYVITSNASLLSEKKARQLVDYGLSFLRVSVYGANAQRYRERTGTKTDLERIKKKLRYLKEYRDKVNGGLSLAVKMLDTGDAEENRAFLETFADYADECFIEPLHNWHDSSGRYAAVQTRGSASPGVCPYPFYTLVVHADMQVSVCCPDWNKKILVGDVKEQRLADIWHGKKLFAVQRALLAGNFKALPVCGGCSFHAINAGDNMAGLTAEAYAARKRSRGLEKV